MNRQLDDRNLADPRLNTIRHCLEHLLQVIELERDGCAVPVDGFRLKNLDHWRSPVQVTLWNNLGPLSSSCNCDCVFCYDHNSPLPYERSTLSLDEVRTRIKYYRKDLGQGLPLSNRLYLEPLCNRGFLEIARMVREVSPSEPFVVVTNGGLLGRELIQELAGLRPVLVNLSLNSIVPSVRQTLMREKSLDISQTAIDSVRWLHEYRIQFDGSIVAWPTLALEEVEDTARYLNHWAARKIALLLPAYNRYNQPESALDFPAHWDRLSELASRLQAELASPVDIQPHLYRMTRPLEPIVDGVVVGSPAARAGLKAGDRIVAVNGTSIYTRSQASGLLHHLARNGGSSDNHHVALLVLQRQGTTFSVELNESSSLQDDFYPYKPLGYPPDPAMPYGLFFVDDLRISFLEQMCQAIGAHGASKVVAFVSSLARPALQAALRLVPEFQQFLADRQVFLETAEHRFWGGNIIVGGLYLVNDYLDHLRVWIAKNGKPDLVIVPSNFVDSWGHDLMRCSYRQIEHMLDVPVVLLRTRSVIY